MDGEGAGACNLYELRVWRLIFFSLASAFGNLLLCMYAYMHMKIWIWIQTTESEMVNGRKCIPSSRSLFPYPNDCRAFPKTIVL
jgi:hypothetical protein